MNGITLFLPAEQALWLFRETIRLILIPINFVSIASVATSTAPFVAFWPYTRVGRNMRPLAVLCLLWGAPDLVSAIIGLTTQTQFGLPNFYNSWEFVLLEVRGTAAACVLIALFVLLFRDYRQVTEERSIPAGEMQAASQIQRMLAPAIPDCASGLKIDVAFHPMRQVGGDFYLCCILPDGRQRILVGDVSGKGAAAAMTAAVLIGAAQRHDDKSPAALLIHLNHVLADMRLGGFGTCLCAELSADGSLTLANAGHCPPYRMGEEIPIEPGLPLGIGPDAGYSESRLQLAPNDQLTFVSDGVVEAQSPAGELFGFDRTRIISCRSAEEIASTAKLFGQQDDITVLTLGFAPAEVVHA